MKHLIAVLFVILFGIPSVNAQDSLNVSRTGVKLSYWGSGPNRNHQMEILENWIAGAGGWSGLTLLDRSDHTHRIVHHLPAEVLGLASHQEYLYVILSDHTLRTFSVDGEGTLQEHSVYDCDARKPVDLFIHGETLGVVGEFEPGVPNPRFYRFSLDDPSTPALQFQTELLLPADRKLLWFEYNDSLLAALDSQHGVSFHEITENNEIAFLGSVNQLGWSPHSCLLVGNMMVYGPLSKAYVWDADTEEITAHRIDFPLGYQCYGIIRCMDAKDDTLIASMESRWTDDEFEYIEGHEAYLTYIFTLSDEYEVELIEGYTHTQDIVLNRLHEDTLYYRFENSFNAGHWLTDPGITPLSYHPMQIQDITSWPDSIAIATNTSLDVFSHWYDGPQLDSRYDFTYPNRYRVVSVERAWHNLQIVLRFYSDWAERAYFYLQNYHLGPMGSYVFTDQVNFDTYYFHWLRSKGPDVVYGGDTELHWFTVQQNGSLSLDRQVTMSIKSFDFNDRHFVRSQWWNNLALHRTESLDELDAVSPSERMHRIGLRDTSMVLTAGPTWEGNQAAYFCLYQITPDEELDFVWSRTLTGHANGNFVHLWNGFAISTTGPDSTGRIEIFDLTDPEDPTLAGWYDAPYPIMVMGYKEGELLVREAGNVLATYDYTAALGVPGGRQCVSLPTSASITSIYPNPFNETVRISYSLPSPGDMRLAVYDLLGREVALIRDGLAPAGRMEVHWKAEGLSSGTYFLQLQRGGEAAEVRRVTLAK
ncbi:T9SS type A sorting domain-containing protein [bacterium]|nr:T9SS type A sorting domain-containing protein [bacterium]